MVRVALFGWLLLVVTVSPAAADEKTKAALIEEMIVVTNAEKLMTDTLAQQKTWLRDFANKTIAADPKLRGNAEKIQPMMQELEDQVFALLSRSLRWDTFKPQLAAIYSELLTEEELAASVAFYKTPAGRSMMQKMPQLMARSMQLSQKQFEAIMPELQKTLEAWQEKVEKAAAAK